MTNIKNILIVAFIILSAVLIRLFPHPANFAPVAAMALFGGAYISKRYSIAIILITLLLSDYLLLYVHPFSAEVFNFSKIYSPLALIHASTASVYGSYLIAALIGVWLRSHKTVRNVIAASLSSSIIFFLITNFNLFYFPALYPKTLSGTIESYVMALPFFKNTLFGDLFYTGLFFGGFEILMKLSKKETYGYLYKGRGQG